MSLYLGSEEDLKKRLSSANNYYLSDDTVKFFKSRVQAVAQAGDNAAVLWETMAGGPHKGNGRIHKVSLFTFGDFEHGHPRSAENETLYHGGEDGVGIATQAKRAEAAFRAARAPRSNPAKGTAGLGALKREADECATRRGHKLVWDNKPHYHNWSNAFLQNGVCACGAEVQVNNNPSPNGIDIGGDAVALNCKQSKAAKKNPMRKAKDDGSPIPVQMVAISLDETEGYEIDPKDKPYIKRILGCFVFDRNSRTFLASSQPSYYLRYLYTSIHLTPKGEELDDSARDAIDQKYAYCYREAQEGDYYDVSYIDRQIEKLSKDKDGRVYIAKEVMPENASDEAREEVVESEMDYLRGNWKVS